MADMTTHPILRTTSPEGLAALRDAAVDALAALKAKREEESEHADALYAQLRAADESDGPHIGRAYDDALEAMGDLDDQIESMKRTIVRYAIEARAAERGKAAA